MVRFVVRLLPESDPLSFAERILSISFISKCETINLLQISIEIRPQAIV